MSCKRRNASHPRCAAAPSHPLDGDAAGCDADRDGVEGRITVDPEISLQSILRGPDKPEVEDPPGMAHELLCRPPDPASIRAALEEGIPAADLFRFRESASAFDVQYRRYGWPLLCTAASAFTIASLCTAGNIVGILC